MANVETGAPDAPWTSASSMTCTTPGTSSGREASAAPRTNAARATAPTHLRIARRYAFAAIGCAAFALVYAQFSHGVYSPFMTFMFAIPLLGGAAVALALHIAHARPVPRGSRQSWALALATLTVGSCLRGIFDIAGTASPYLIVYLAAAAVFAATAIALIVRSRLKEPTR